MKSASKLGVLAAMAAAMSANADMETYEITNPYGRMGSSPRAYSVNLHGPIFIPRKHNKMSYAKQNRLAKARKNNRKKR